MPYLLRKSHAETLNVLLQLYARETRKNFSEASLNAYYELHGTLPPLRTFNRSIQKTLHMGSKGTVYAHRDRLRNAGAIQSTRYDPLQACQFWYFNPIFFALFSDENMVENYVDKHFSARISFHLENPDLDVRAVLRLISVPIQAKNYIDEENIINRVDTVDNSTTSRKYIRSLAQPDNGKIARNLPGTFAGNTGKQGNFRDENNRNFSAQPIEQVRERPRTDSKPGGAPKSQKNPTIRPKIPAFILTMVTDFWVYAKATLYRGYVFSQEEERWAKNAIYYSYFSHWRRQYNPKEKDWHYHVETLRKQVDLSKAIADKKGYVFPKPSYYFAAKNPNATTEFKFYKTYDMLAQNTYDSIKLELRKWKKRQGKLKEKSRLELMKRHFGMIESVGHPDYIAKFQGLKNKGYQRSAH